MKKEEFEQNSEWVSEVQKILYEMAVPMTEIDITVAKIYDITKRLFKK